jgi:hypothetical protein
MLMVNSCNGKATPARTYFRLKVIMRWIAMAMPSSAELARWTGPVLELERPPQGGYYDLAAAAGAER